MFNLPNKDAAANQNQSILFQDHLKVLAEGIAHTQGVIYGLEVTAQTVPNMTVQVASGRNVDVLLSAAPAVVIAAADALSGRFDYVCATLAGTIAIRTGTPSVKPQPPARVTGDTALASIYVPPNVTAITADLITDLRVIYSPNIHVVLSYAELRAYEGTSAVRLAAADVGGDFLLDVEDVVSVDNGATVVVDAGGRRWKRQIKSAVSVKYFGAAGDIITDNTTAIQNAIDYLAGIGGGELCFDPGIYSSGPITLKSRVILRGSGRGATVLKLKAGANADLLTVPADSALVGWSQITFNGNAQENTLGSCIVIEAVGGSDGDSFTPYTDGVDTPPESYKHIIATDWIAGNAAEDGVYIAASNYQCFFDNFVVSHCGRDGLSVHCADSLFSNFYAEKNGRCGLLASGSNNKFSVGKVIWNGRTDKTYGGCREQGTANQFICIEAQDNYTDGLLILGSYPVFIGCASNTNGYLAVGSEDQSTGAHADIRVGSTAVGIRFVGRCYSYKTAVGTDGLWTTQWPYYFNAYATMQVVQWTIEFDPAKYNAPPNTSTECLTRGKLGEISSFSSDGIATFLDISPKSLTGVGNKTLRFFRNSETTGTCAINVYVPGTANVNHSLNANGSTTINGQAGDCTVGNGAWDGRRLRLGTYTLWVTATGILRIKNGIPTSETDGTVVGAQT
jgi:hypothetical protein